VSNVNNTSGVANAQKSVILVTGADLAAQALSQLSGFDAVYAGKTIDEENLVALCTKHQPVAIIVRYGRITARVINASKKLRVISKHGTGIDTIDVQAAKECGVQVKAAVGANAAAVAEHTWALIFACAKEIVSLDQRMHAGHWDKATHKSLELKGRTLGLVGLGAVGSRVAAIGQVLGMRVIAYDPFATQLPENVTKSSLPEVLSDADVLSLHCPLTKENAKMINAATLATMRDGAIVVNTARGSLIDEHALIETLRSGKLRAAGLDSFENEPLVGKHHFAHVPNVIMTPHIGGITSDAYIGMGTAAAQNILNVLAAENQTAAA
jgi:D-3-phosphoglycerate dehydrogenase